MTKHGGWASQAVARCVCVARLFISQRQGQMKPITTQCAIICWVVLTMAGFGLVIHHVVTVGSSPSTDAHVGWVFVAAAVGLVASVLLLVGALVWSTLTTTWVLSLVDCTDTSESLDHHSVRILDGNREPDNYGLLDDDDEPPN